MLNEFGQWTPSEFRMALQEAIEAQQRLLFGAIAIAEDAHVRDMLVHHCSKDASEARKPALRVKCRVAIFTDEGAHDRRGAWTILPMQFGKWVRRDQALVVQPLEISLDQEASVIEDVRRPLETALLQPLLHD
jgi:type IV secretory pathway VirB9-like protein